jgi:hypothetical protein
LLGLQKWHPAPAMSLALLPKWICSGNEQGGLRERHFPQWGVTPGKMIALGTKRIYKRQCVPQRWTSVLKGSCGRTHPLFKGMLSHYVIMPQIQ